MLVEGVHSARLLKKFVINNTELELPIISYVADKV